MIVIDPLQLCALRIHVWSLHLGLGLDIASDQRADILEWTELLLSSLEMI